MLLGASTVALGADAAFWIYLVFALWLGFEAPALRRAAFALRLGDFNLLISNLITTKSRIMFVRDVQVMATKAAPFLSFDANPYSVVVDGQLEWVLDGYTTTDRYPYSQNASNLQLPSGSGLPNSYNYVRNSVKLVVNAYTGKMTYYVMDPSDPIIQTYEKAFPTLLTPKSKMPAALVAHLRYPEDIFSAQVATYGRYHITNPASFYNAGDAWTISQTSGAGSPTQTLAVKQTVNAQGFIIQGQAERMSPIYQVNSLPGTTTQTFTISEAYVPKSNSDHIQNLAAFMVGTSDPSNYGELNVYVTPSGQNVIGPVMADSEIQQSTRVSSIITPLDQHGSNVLLGNTLMIPINQSMLYVRPLYVTSATSSLPQMKYVIAVFNSHVDIESSLSLALSNVLSADVQVPGQGPARPGGGLLRPGADRPQGRRPGGLPGGRRLDVQAAAPGAGAVLGHHVRVGGRHDDQGIVQHVRLDRPADRPGDDHHHDQAG